MSTPYPWYFEWLPMVFWPPFDGILTRLPISWLEMRGFKIPWDFNLPYRGEFSIRVSIYHRWKLTPRSIYHGGQHTIWHRLEMCRRRVSYLLWRNVNLLRIFILELVFRCYMYNYLHCEFLLYTLFQTFRDSISI